MAKAVIAALRDSGFGHGVVVARNEAKGRALAAQYGFEWSAEIGDATAPLLVNVTPLGMAGADADALAFPQACIERCDVAFDVVALPAVTPMLAAATAAGKRVVTGADVAVLQALEQFVLYTGVTPSPAQVADAAAFAAQGRAGS